MTETQKIPWNRLSVEAAAIVASILLAFAIDAWWRASQERQAELDYLIALQKDFLETRESLDKQLDDASVLFDRVDQVLAVIADTKTASLPVSFSLMIGSSYHIPRPVSITGTYEDMVNSGNLQLMRDEKLRVAMAEFMSVLKIIEFHSNLNVEIYWALHTPFLNRHLIASEFGWNAKVDNTDSEVVFLVRPPIKQPFELDVDAIKTQEFWNLMTGWKVLHTDQLIQVIQARDLCTDILKMLEEEIESHSR